VAALVEEELLYRGVVEDVGADDGVYPSESRRSYSSWVPIQNQ